jgi:hypothetical protein
VPWVLLAVVLCVSIVTASLLQAKSPVKRSASNIMDKSFFMGASP